MGKLLLAHGPASIVNWMVLLFVGHIVFNFSRAWACWCAVFFCGQFSFLFFNFNFFAWLFFDYFLWRLFLLSFFLWRLCLFSFFLGRVFLFAFFLRRLFFSFFFGRFRFLTFRSCNNWINNTIFLKLNPLILLDLAFVSSFSSEELSTLNFLLPVLIILAGFSSNSSITTSSLSFSTAPKCRKKIE